MTELRKHLVVAILKFLKDQTVAGGLSDDAIESLEVASQCLEAAYGIFDPLDELTSGPYPLPASLEEIFQAGLQQKKSQKIGPEASAADKEAADKLKQEGNEFMKSEKVTEAIDCYTRAIELDSHNAVYYCNRAAAFNKQSLYDRAVEDCSIALEIDNTYSKAYNRKGVAHMSLQQYREAHECFKRALDLDPQNEGYKSSLEQAKQRLSESDRGGSAPAMGGLNLGGLDFSSILNNPALMNMASSMMSNPTMQQMMANMMGGGGGGGSAGPGAGPGNPPAEESGNISNLLQAEGPPGGPGNMSDLLQAGQQLAQQMQQSNPELVENLRREFRQQGEGGDDGGTGPNTGASGGSS